MWTNFNCCVPYTQTAKAGSIESLLFFEVKEGYSVFQSVLSFVIVAKMELGFLLAVIALGLYVTAAGFIYFFYDNNLYRGLREDHPEERALNNHRQQRNRRRGRWLGTDSPINENFTAHSLLRQRPKPQENDEPLWQTVGI